MVCIRLLFEGMPIRLSAVIKVITFHFPTLPNPTEREVKLINGGSDKKMVNKSKIRGFV